MTRRRKNLIYLTGFMGSGKSTIAPILANTLGYTSRDIDAEIEQVTGKKVSDIFTDHGETYFRETEQRLLRESSRLEGCIVSLGGGTIANTATVQLVNSSGFLFFLVGGVNKTWGGASKKPTGPPPLPRFLTPARHEIDE